MYRIALLWLLATLTLGGTARTARASESGPPIPEHWSANKRFVLKVDSALSNENSLALIRNEGGRLDLLEISRRLKKYKNSLTLFRKDGGRLVRVWKRHFAPPGKAYVANDGRNIVLKDRHDIPGHGKVLIFLGPRGDVLRSYELQDLLTRDQIYPANRVLPARSGIWWSSPDELFFLNHERHFAFLTDEGAMGFFDVATGAPLPLTAVRQAAIRRFVAEKHLKQGVTRTP